jgi:hypothetical protein
MCRSSALSKLALPKIKKKKFAGYAEKQVSFVTVPIKTAKNFVPT